MAVLSYVPFLYDHFYLQEGFAFAHCTTCKAPYHLRVHVAADRRWRTLKFRFFVTRDIISIFLAVQFVSQRCFNLHCSSILCYFVMVICCSQGFQFPCYVHCVQVIASLAYLVYLIDSYHQSWLRTAWGFDSELSFYYICGKNFKNLK